MQVRVNALSEMHIAISCGKPKEANEKLAFIMQSHIVKRKQIDLHCTVVMMKLKLNVGFVVMFTLTAIVAAVWHCM